MTLSSVLMLAMVEWVFVANPEGIANGNNFFRFGESCVLTTTKGVEALRGAVDGKRLYRVTTVVGLEAGTVCPVGTLLLLDPQTFTTWQAREREEAEQAENLRKAIQIQLAPPAASQP
jgi:hypothetical protein